MNAFIKGLSIFVLSLSLFACGDSAEKTAEKGESAIEAMNSMSSEITSYANDDLSTMSVSELEYTKKRLNKYIKHADRAIKSINDPDTLYFGNEDDIYTNRSFALGILSDVNQEITLRKDPAAIKKKSEKENLENLINQMVGLGPEIENLGKSLKTKNDFDKIALLTVPELKQEKSVFQKINKKNKYMVVLINRIENHSAWDDYSRILSSSNRQGLEEAFEHYKELDTTNLYQQIIDYIDQLILEKTSKEDFFQG